MDKWLRRMHWIGLCVYGVVRVSCLRACVHWIIEKRRFMHRFIPAQPCHSKSGAAIMQTAEIKLPSELWHTPGIMEGAHFFFFLNSRLLNFAGCARKTCRKSLHILYACVVRWCGVHHKFASFVDESMAYIDAE